MNVISAIFTVSSSSLGQCPSDGLPEFAFIGRSNVGKSSLINMLTDSPSLAKVSSTPGKTRLVNHFLVNGSWYLVDLPGYVLRREQMVFLFVLLDSRHEPQKIDLRFIEMLGRAGVPFGLVFTKTDKLSADRLASNVARYRRVLLESWEELPPVFLTSSEKKKGRAEILDFIGRCLRSASDR